MDDTWFLSVANRQVGDRPRRGNVDMDCGVDSGEHAEECEQQPQDLVTGAKEKGEGEKTILDRCLKTRKEQAEEGEPGEEAEKPEGGGKLRDCEPQKPRGGNVPPLVRQCG